MPRSMAPSSSGLLERKLIATDADDVCREPPRAQRQADRTADQADADDGHSPETLQGTNLLAQVQRFACRSGFSLT